jgi:hypothetical protein
MCRNGVAYLVHVALLNDRVSGRTKTGRLWCYAVDNRPWCGPGHPTAAYVYSEDRKGEHPQILMGAVGFIRRQTGVDDDRVPEYP